MSKKIIRLTLLLLLVFLFIEGPLFAGDSGILRGLEKPDMIRVQGNQLYVMEGAVVRVYSLRDLRLLRKFGDSGYGEGKLPVPVEGANIIRLTHEYLLAEGRNKMIFFSKIGEVINEKRKSDLCTQFTPLGKIWAAKKYFHDVKTNTQYMTVALFNGDLEVIKEVYREKWFQQYTDKGFRIQLISDYLNFEVYDGKIFIEKSPLGFVIDVYDAGGTFLYRIKKEVPPLKVSEADKVAAMKFLRQGRKAEVMTLQMGSWEKVLAVMDVIYPQYKPVIRNKRVCSTILPVKEDKMSMVYKEKIIPDLNDIPVDMLPKLYKIVHLLKTELLETSSRNKNRHSLKGIWKGSHVDDHLFEEAKKPHCGNSSFI